MKTIIHNTENGKVVITSISDDISVVDYCQKYLNGETHYLILSNGDAIPDSYFQEAWKFENFILSIDIEKAKQIQLERFRNARDPILKKLDIQFMRAVENDDKDLQKSISAKKQELRDITLLKLSNDLNEIKNTWPDVLKT
jgi:hypothetical protein